MDTLSEDVALDTVPLDTVAFRTNVAHLTTLLQESLFTLAHLEETPSEPVCLEDVPVDTLAVTTSVAHKPPPPTHSSALMELKLPEDVSTDFAELDTLAPTVSAVLEHLPLSNVLMDLMPSEPVSHLAPEMDAEEFKSHTTADLDTLAPLETSVAQSTVVQTEEKFLVQPSTDSAQLDTPSKETSAALLPALMDQLDLLLSTESVSPDTPLPTESAVHQLSPVLMKSPSDHVPELDSTEDAQLDMPVIPTMSTAAQSSLMMLNLAKSDQLLTDSAHQDTLLSTFQTLHSSPMESTQEPVLIFSAQLDFAPPPIKSENVTRQQMPEHAQLDTLASQMLESAVVQPLSAVFVSVMLDKWLRSQTTDAHFTVTCLLSK